MRRQKPSPGKTLSTKVACAPSKSEPGSSTRAVSPLPSTIRIGAITSSRPKICRGPLSPYHIGEQHYEYEHWHRWHRKDGPARCLSLLEHGFAVYGYRRHMIGDFITMGGTPVSSSKEVAQHSDIDLTCLPTDEALLEVIEGENGLIHGAHPGLIVVEISMLSIQAKEQALTHLQRVGVEMLDCPISGTPALVLPRKTVFFGSGDEEIFHHCLPVLQAITDNNFYLGGFGAGSKMKCVANLLVAVHTLAAAEAMVLSTKAGLDPEMVMKVINPSIAGSTMLAARGPMMAARRYEPPL